MKKLRLTVLLTCVAVATSGVAQSQPDASQKQYFFVLLTRPADPPQLSKEAGEKLQEDHMRPQLRSSRMKQDTSPTATPGSSESSFRVLYTFQCEL